MKMQVSRSNMLAEEMVRYAITHIPERPIAEYRLLDINFKTLSGEPRIQRAIEVSGHVIVFEPGTPTDDRPIDLPCGPWIPPDNKVRIYWFGGEMFVAKHGNDNWRPTAMYFQLQADVLDRDNPTAISGQCEFNPQVPGLYEIRLLPKPKK